jgi:5-formyltetrahydrofolate cyclo-ligase
MTDKKELRKLAKEIRNSLDLRDISEKIVKNIQSLDEYKNAQKIMLYFPLSDEINMLGLMKDDKEFYLPKVDGDNLLVCPFKKGDELKMSSFKTFEPITEPIDPEMLDLIIVPALMVDKLRFRLGYGGGFYDRFLSKNAKNALRIVGISCALIIKELPSDAFDEQIDIIVCEEIVIK